MLQLKTIHKETFALLSALSSCGELQSFSLAGGTALALQLGHRISIDLDLFTQKPFDTEELFVFLRDTFTVSNCTQAVNSLTLNIESGNEEIRVDILRHNYPLLLPVQTAGHIRIFSLEDIAAMKLNAIANRGSKKDFYDIYSLLTSFSIDDLLSFFKEKYQHKNCYTVIKSLVYFADADLEPDPRSLIDTTWDDIKNHFHTVVAAL